MVLVFLNKFSPLENMYFKYVIIYKLFLQHLKMIFFIRTGYDIRLISKELFMVQVFFCNVGIQNLQIKSNLQNNRL